MLQLTPNRMWCLWLILICCGCESDVPEGAPATPEKSAPAAAPVTETTTTPEVAPMEIPTISLSSGGKTLQSDRSAASAKGDSDQKRRDLLSAMKPLQIMLGSWHGTTQKAVGDFKALDQPEWVWDFQSNRNQPAMVMTSSDSPYFANARLTYLTDEEAFELMTTDPEGNQRRFHGTFSSPVEEFQGDDQKMHVKYKLKLEQVNAASPRDTWQVVFNQQDNHRYLMELYRGPQALRFDTVATQREGSSFGKSDVGYGERECIISGGLGTMQVSYQGKSYWVCCTGCKAAFDEDPATWIAEYQAKQAAKE